MKVRVTAVILLLIISIPMLSKVTLWVYFFSNRTEIAETKCINKDIPESCCKGKCYLGSQLKKVEEPNQQKNQSLPVIKKFKDIPFEIKEILNLSPSLKFLSSQRIPEFNQPLTCPAIKSVFHPPEA